MPITFEGPLGPQTTEDGHIIGGRYSIIVDSNSVFARPDLHSDFAVSVRLAGQWIDGHIRHNTEGRYAIETPKGVYHGYYFEALDGSVCGLCVGMWVRLERFVFPL